MDIKKIIDFIDKMTENDAFDFSTFKLLKEQHPALSKSDKKVLLNRISKYKENGCTVTLNLIKAYAIWEPDEAIFEARKKGIFRYKIWSEENCARIIMDSLICSSSLFGFSDSSLQFLNNKLKLSWLYDYYKKEEWKILKLLRKFHRNRKIKESDSCSLEEGMIKNLLVYADDLFYKTKTTAHGNFNDLSGYSLEQVADSISYLIFMFYNNIGVKENCLYFANRKTIESSEFQKVVLRGCKLCQVIEWEVLVDFFDYDVIESPNKCFTIKPKDPNFEKSCRLAYILQEMQSNLNYQRTIDDENGLSLEDVCGLNSLILKRVKQYGIERVQFALDTELIQCLNDIKDDEAYVEEIITLRSFEHEYLFAGNSSLDFKISKLCTLKDVLIFQRLFIFLNYLTLKYLYLNETKEVIINSLVPSFSQKILQKLMLEIYKNKDKANEMIELFTATFDRKIDLQYTPIILMNGQYSIPVSLISRSNLIRNCIASSRATGNQQTNSIDEPMVNVCANIFKNCSLSLEVLTNKKIKYQNKTGEIDVVVISDNTILVIECKCPLFPVNNFEMRGDYDHLLKAQNQLDVCRKALEDEKYQKELLKNWGVAFKPRNVLTCIVFGNRLFNGLSFNSHPVRYIHELNNFLNNGYIRTQKKEYRMWSTTKLREEDLLKYLSDESSVIRHRFDAMLEVPNKIKLNGMTLIQDSFAVVWETMEYQLETRFISKRKTTL